ncbi:hypothetical protein Tco_0539354 [Tanacetum coccineum]
MKSWARTKRNKCQTLLNRICSKYDKSNIASYRGITSKEQKDYEPLKERSKMFMELMDKRKKHFARLRAEEQRIKPPTKAQKRKLFDKAMTKHMEIVPDGEVAIDAIPLATKPPINIDWKIIKEGKIGYFQIIRADGSSRRYSSMIKMLQNIEREDLETLWKLVKAKHGNTRPEEAYERVINNAPLPTSTATTTTITTTTTLPPPPPQPQQSTTDPILLQRIGEHEQHMANLIQDKSALEERLNKHGSRLYNLENLNIPQKVSKAHWNEICQLMQLTGLSQA